MVVGSRLVDCHDETARGGSLVGHTKLVGRCIEVAGRHYLHLATGLLALLIQELHSFGISSERLRDDGLDDFLEVTCIPLSAGPEKTPLLPPPCLRREDNTYEFFVLAHAVINGHSKTTKHDCDEPGVMERVSFLKL